MDKEVYEVTRDEYVGFISQIKPEFLEREIYENPESKEIRIVSKDGKRHFASMFALENEAKYYVFEMPKDDERQAAKPVRKIVLETKEEVEHFFKALKELQKGRAIS